VVLETIGDYGISLITFVIITLFLNTSRFNYRLMKFMHSGDK